MDQHTTRRRNRTLPSNPEQLQDWLDIFLEGKAAPAANAVPLIQPAPSRVTDRLWVVTTQFNPANYTSLAQNYLRFAKHIQDSGVNLLTAELTYPGQEPNIEGSLRFEAHSVMWHKERLLNLAIRQLPPECDMIAWIDADVTFTNPNWIQHTIDQLQRVPVAQMFEQCIMVDAVGDHYKDAYGFAFSLNSGFLDNPGERYGYFNGNYKHPGFAWAARRETIDAWGGLYDRHILGGGDFQMGLALAGEQDSDWYGRFGPTFQQDMLSWSHRAIEVTGGKLGFVQGMVVHMWHGHSEDRQYVERSKCLVDYDFNPKCDIDEDDSGLWKWSSDKPGMHRKVAEYFGNRKEDHNFPIHPTRYVDKYPIVVDPVGNVPGIRQVLERLAAMPRTDFCVHIACYDWQQAARIKPLLREHPWPFQIKARTTYPRPNQEVPRRLQLVRLLGHESQARRVVFADRDTVIQPNFLHRVTRNGKALVLDHLGRLLMADRDLLSDGELQSAGCRWGKGEERVVEYAQSLGKQVIRLDLRQ